MIALPLALQSHLLGLSPWFGAPLLALFLKPMFACACCAMKWPASKRRSEPEFQPLRYTHFEREKTLRHTEVRFQPVAGDWSALADLAFDGYEIRCGGTEAGAGATIALRNGDGEAIGWQHGAVLGLSAHGLFEAPAAMNALFGVETRPLGAVFDGLADFIDARFEPGSLRRLIERQG